MKAIASQVVVHHLGLNLRNIDSAAATVADLNRPGEWNYKMNHDTDYGTYCRSQRAIPLELTDNGSQNQLWKVSKEGITIQCIDTILVTTILMECGIELVNGALRIPSFPKSPPLILEASSTPAVWHLGIEFRTKEEYLKDVQQGTGIIWDRLRKAAKPKRESEMLRVPITKGFSLELAIGPLGLSTHRLSARRG